MAVEGHLNRPIPNVVHLALLEGVENEALREIVKRRSLNLYIFKFAFLGKFLEYDRIVREI